MGSRLLDRLGALRSRRAAYLPRPLAWRVGRAALVVIGAALAVALALSLYVRARAASLVRARAVEIAERTGARIGRAITIGPAHVDLGAELRIQLDDVRVAAAPAATGPAAEPLLELAAVRVRVSAWSILRSRGEDLEVIAVDVAGPVIRVVRAADGQLSYADVLARIQAEAEPPAEARRRARIGRVTVSGGSIELTDLSRGGSRLAIRKIDAGISEIRAGGPIDLGIEAAVLAPDHNLRVQVALGPVAAPRGPLGRVEYARVRLARVAIDPLVPFLPKRGGIGVVGATLTGDVKLGVDPGGTVAVDAAIDASTLRLVHDVGGREEALGTPIDAALRLDASVDPSAPSLSARAFSITAEGMSVDGHVDVRGSLAAPEVRALSVRSRDLRFEKILALLPAGILPAGVSLAGPIAIQADARGAPRAAEIAVAVDLRDAAVKIPALHKPAGTPLAAELAGRLGDGGLTLDALGLRLGPLALSLRGQVRSASDLDLTFDSGEVGLDALLRLLPSVAGAVPPGVTLAGAVQAKGAIHRKGEETRAEARVALRRADVRTTALTLVGAASLDAVARSTPGALSFTLALGADGARVTVPGKLDKAAGSPLSVHVAGERRGAITTLREARLQLAGASISGALRHDAAARAITIERCRAELDLGALSRAVPALALVPAPLLGARLRIAGSLTGDPADLGAATVRVDELDLRAPLGHLRGTLSLTGVRPPRRVSFDLEGDALDLDRLGREGGAAMPAADAVTVHGKLRLARLRARGVDARDVTVEGALDRGALTLTTLRLGALGGTLDAGGSRLDLARGAPGFVARARIAGLDLGAVAVARGDTSGDLTGQLDAEISLDGRGSTWAEVAPTLTGTAKLTLTRAHVHTQHTLRGTIVNPLLGKLAERSREKHPTREVNAAIERASTLLYVGGGKVTTTSILVKSEDGLIDVSGSVGFDRSLALSGTVVIPPAAIERSSKGKLLPKGDVTVKVRIDGAAGSPKIELVDLGATARSLLGSRWNEIVNGKGAAP